MISVHAVSALAVGRLPFGLGALLALLLGVAVPLGTPLSGQTTAQPDVVYAAAPEWPLLDNTQSEQPHKEAVRVRVQVDGFGNVVDVKVLTPSSVYSTAASHAAWLWKFAEPEGVGPDPAKLNGMKATLTFTFQLLPAGTSIDEAGIGFVPPYDVYFGRLIRAKR